MLQHGMSVEAGATLLHIMPGLHGFQPRQDIGRLFPRGAFAMNGSLWCAHLDCFTFCSKVGLRIDVRGAYVDVTEPGADDVNVNASVEQMYSCRVSNGVWRDAFVRDGSDSRGRLLCIGIENIIEGVLKLN